MKIHQRNRKGGIELSYLGEEALKQFRKFSKQHRETADDIIVGIWDRLDLIESALLERGILVRTLDLSLGKKEGATYREWAESDENTSGYIADGYVYRVLADAESYRPDGMVDFLSTDSSIEGRVKETDVIPHYSPKSPMGHYYGTLSDIDADGELADASSEPNTATEGDTVEGDDL